MGLAYIQVQSLFSEEFEIWGGGLIFGASAYRNFTLLFFITNIFYFVFVRVIYLFFFHPGPHICLIYCYILSLVSLIYTVLYRYLPFCVLFYIIVFVSLQDLVMLQSDYCYRGRPDKVSQSQSRTRAIHSNVFFFIWANPTSSTEQWNFDLFTRELKMNKVRRWLFNFAVFHSKVCGGFEFSRQIKTQPLGVPAVLSTGMVSSISLGRKVKELFWWIPYLTEFLFPDNLKTVNSLCSLVINSQTRIFFLQSLRFGW